MQMFWNSVHLQGNSMEHSWTRNLSVSMVISWLWWRVVSASQSCSTLSEECRPQLLVWHFEKRPAWRHRKSSSALSPHQFLHYPCAPSLSWHSWVGHLHTAPPPWPGTADMAAAPRQCSWWGAWCPAAPPRGGLGTWRWTRCSSLPSSECSCQGQTMSDTRPRCWSDLRSREGVVLRTLIFFKRSDWF